MNKILTTGTLTALLLGTSAYSNDYDQVLTPSSASQYNQSVSQEEPKLLEPPQVSGFTPVYKLQAPPSIDDQKLYKESQQPTLAPPKNKPKKELKLIPDPNFSLPRDYDIHVAPLKEKYEPLPPAPKVREVPLQRPEDFYPDIHSSPDFPSQVMDHPYQIHTLVSGLNLPEFPWASADVITEKKLFGLKKEHRFLSLDTMGFDHQGGIGVIDTFKELGILANQTSILYKGPANPDAFENLCKNLGIPKDFVTSVEGSVAYSSQPSIYDSLATVGTFGKHRVVKYTDRDGNTRVFGNLNDVQKLK